MGCYLNPQLLTAFTNPLTLTYPSVVDGSAYSPTENRQAFVFAAKGSPSLPFCTGLSRPYSLRALVRAFVLLDLLFLVSSSSNSLGSVHNLDGPF